nr:hypothetical protein [Pseudoxanthomonas sp.]
MSYDLTNPAKPTITKDPNAVLDYSLDLAAWLTDISDTLSALSVTASGATVDSSAISGTKCIAWISGGTAGETVTVTFRFTTAGGRTDDRSIYLKIKDR